MDAKRILIVDDDEALTTSLLAVLQSEGYTVDTARSGQEAITNATVNLYDLMIIDIELPDIEGTDLLQRLPAQSAKAVKIILTGHPNMDKVVTALFRGADAYVLKPVSPDELLKVVEQKLATQRAATGMNSKKLADWIERRAHKM